MEQTLHEDPAGVYGQMDFATRDRYRHAVENLAKHAAPCRKATSLATQSCSRIQGRPKQGQDSRTAHVGFYLVENGQTQLEQAVGMRLSAFETVRRWSGSGAVPVYLGSILFLTAMFTGGFLAARPRAGLEPMAPCAAGDHFVVSRQSIGGHAGELARHGVGDTALLSREWTFPMAFPRHYERWWWFRRSSNMRGASTTCLKPSKSDSSLIGTSTCISVS